ncbi:hypothetical protein [Phenylobacterium sp.]|jgi:hypothetical protein|uniref:hypothetical protein n=1 Tax=Phenylobacterium sp. TaxID=1871053 RepID=UPI002F925A7D
MQNPRETRTNAADSAPGVDDGRVRANGAPVNSKPGGRKAVWLLIAASLIILIAVFVARPRDNGGSSEMVAAGTTNTEVEGSRAPGTLAEAGRPAQQP